MIDKMPENEGEDRPFQNDPFGPPQNAFGVGGDPSFPIKPQWCVRHWAPIRDGVKAGTMSMVAAAMAQMNFYMDRADVRAAMEEINTSGGSREEVVERRNAYVVECSPLCCFLGDEVQEKIHDISRRAMPKNADMPMGTDEEITRIIQRNEAEVMRRIASGKFRVSEDMEFSGIINAAPGVVIECARWNFYRCDRCHGFFTTVDVHRGTTPMLLGCRVTKNCVGTMRSAWYPHPATWPPIVPKEAMGEWYRPTVAERATMKRKHPHLYEHVMKGGLVLRRPVEGVTPSFPSFVVMHENDFKRLADQANRPPEDEEGEEWKKGTKGG